MPHIKNKIYNKKQQTVKQINSKALVFLYLKENENLPVVRAGVHSCSPVAPHSKVRLFDGFFGGIVTL